MEMDRVHSVGRDDHPRPVHEQVRGCRPNPGRLAARHRVPAHERDAEVLGRGHDQALRAGNVRDRRALRCRRTKRTGEVSQLLEDRTGRSREHDKSGALDGRLGAHADLVDQAPTEALGRPASARRPGHEPSRGAGRPESERDGTADQSEPEQCDSVRERGCRRRPRRVRHLRTRRCHPAAAGPCVAAMRAARSCRAALGHPRDSSAARPCAGYQPDARRTASRRSVDSAVLRRTGCRAMRRCRRRVRRSGRRGSASGRS